LTLQALQRLRSTEVTKSLYFEDPDGNGIEVYVDASDVWRREPQRVARVMPLEL
jgi:catechol-2,3-dioxygenase